MITTSEIKISVLVAREQGLAALRTVHRVFELDKPPAGLATPRRKMAGGNRSQQAAGDAAAVVARLQGMEDLTISDIKLDDTQAARHDQRRARHAGRGGASVRADRRRRHLCRHDRAKLRPARAAPT